MDIDEAKEMFEVFRSDLDQWTASYLSETDTRCKIIDFILKDVLGWPEHSIEREPHVAETNGFIDYLLYTTHPYFIIEAKKTREDLNLPGSSGGGKSFYKIGGVLSDGNRRVMSAIEQARSYAISKGVSFCCVTNGWQFVFFRSHNAEGISWSDHEVQVFRDLDEVYNNFELFYSILSYNTSNLGNLPKFLPVKQQSEGQEKDYIRVINDNSGKAKTRERNKLYPQLKEIIRKVFQSIASESPSTELLEHCYVESSRDSSYGRGLEQLLKDQSSLVSRFPNAKQLRTSRKSAGEFQETFEQHSSDNKHVPEVLLILGGVGAGKTTFIYRFRKVLARESIDNNCLWAYINFNRFSGSGENLLEWTSSTMLESLHQDYPELKLDEWSMLKQIYHADYEKLKRGALAPIFKRNPDQFDERFAEVLVDLMSDHSKHVLKLLKTSSKRFKRRPFLVFDNADQHDIEMQNRVFLLAQKFAEEIGCSCIISLREESYWKNRSFGALSAFHSTSYHVRSPRFQLVLSSRFKYAEKLVDEQRFYWQNNSISSEDLSGVLRLVKSTLLSKDSRYIKFAELLAPGEARQQLEFIARFLYSGHTNVDSLLRAARRNRHLTIGFHEFIGSIILGDSQHFSESASDIINLFALDGGSDASHFNRLALLGFLLNSQDRPSSVGQGYVLISDLINDCENVGMSSNTARAIINLMVSRRLLETETQIRSDISGSEFIRATVASNYYVDVLCNEFAYLELMIEDTPIAKGPYSQAIIDLIDRANQESSRLEKLRLRLDKTQEFLLYLQADFHKSQFCRLSNTNENSCYALINMIVDTFKSTRTSVYQEANRVLKASY